MNVCLKGPAERWSVAARPMSTDLSREMVKWLKNWLEHAKIRDGAIFRQLIGAEQIGGALNPGSIAPVFRRMARWIGMPARFVTDVSGHLTWVGAAPGLAALDIDWATITQAGRRKEVDANATAVCGEDQSGAVGTNRYPSSNEQLWWIAVF